MRAPQKMYPVIYVTDMCETIWKELKRNSAGRLRTSCPKGSKFVIRYSSRSKKYEVYDIRRYVPGYMVHRPHEFYFAPQPSVTTPNLEVALGYARIMP